VETPLLIVVVAYVPALVVEQLVIPDEDEYVPLPHRVYPVEAEDAATPLILAKLPAGAIVQLVDFVEDV